ncbi:hypothetical protein R3I93_002372 [Phoxinus phoxinus]|uniref:Myb/SANT-like DNA-binding domain-containing protein n=1 Tax=Phoxinus phoxinus TaxID=58324 RepID=A0AAN9DQD3_9TELE
MEASKETFVVLPVSQYKQLQNKYEVHVKNITEEERRRRRVLISSVLRSTQRLILKNEADGELGETAETTTSPTSESKMAAQHHNIYLDNNVNMFMDPERSTPFTGPLYQTAADPTTYYLNEDMTIMINMVEAEDMHTIKESQQENSDAASNTLPSLIPLPANDGFNKEQTLFLINLMRQHIEREGEGLPKTLEELNARLKSAMRSKKHLWRDAADKLSSHFLQSFCPDKVARKWNTLIEAYKKIKDSNKPREKGSIRFKFYLEMDALLEKQQEVFFPVVGTSVGLKVRRPEALGQCSSDTALTTPPSPATPPLKRQRVDCELMQFLQDSEEACQRRHEETLAQLRSAQLGFETLMTKLLDKL